MYDKVFVFTYVFTHHIYPVIVIVLNWVVVAMCVVFHHGSSKLMKLQAKL